jgi:hypothetical protein
MVNRQGLRLQGLINRLTGQVNTIRSRDLLVIVKSAWSGRTCWTPSIGTPPFSLAQQTFGGVQLLMIVDFAIRPVLKDTDWEI